MNRLSCLLDHLLSPLMPAERVILQQAKALRYIAASYTQKLTLQHVAEEVGISPNHFSSLFHKTVGVSFREYLS